MPKRETINELPCLVCGNTVQRDDHSSGDWRSIPASNWGEAGTVEISCGYGSQFDMGVYHAVICDQCILNHSDRLRQAIHTYQPPRETTYADGLQPVFFDQLAINTTDAKFTAARREEQMERVQEEFLRSIKPE